MPHSPGAPRAPRLGRKAVAPPGPAPLRGWQWHCPLCPSSVESGVHRTLGPYDRQAGAAGTGPWWPEPGRRRGLRRWRPGPSPSPPVPQPSLHGWDQGPSKSHIDKTHDPRYPRLLPSASSEKPTSCPLLGLQAAQVPPLEFPEKRGEVLLPAPPPGGLPSLLLGNLAGLTPRCGAASGKTVGATQDQSLSKPQAPASPDLTRLTAC